MKINISFLFVFFTVFIGLAQESQEPIVYDYIEDWETVEKQNNVQFGVIAGYTQSRISKIVNQRPKDGFYFGLVLESEVEDKLKIQFDAIYKQMGVKIKEQETFLSPRLNDQVILNYLAAAFVVKYYFSEFYTQFGLEYSLLVRAQEEVNGIKNSIWEEHRQYDGGFILGCGYNLTKNFYLDIRSYIGLESIFRDEVDTVNKYNYGLSFGLGVKF